MNLQFGQGSVKNACLSSMRHQSGWPKWEQIPRLGWLTPATDRLVPLFPSMWACPRESSQRMCQLLCSTVSGVQEWVSKETEGGTYQFPKMGPETGTAPSWCSVGKTQSPDSRERHMDSPLTERCQRNCRLCSASTVSFI